VHTITHRFGGKARFIASRTRGHHVKRPNMRESMSGRIQTTERATAPRRRIHQQSYACAFAHTACEAN
jgi:hypothetical protein